MLGPGLQDLSGEGDRLCQRVMEKETRVGQRRYLQEREIRSSLRKMGKSLSGRKIKDYHPKQSVEPGWMLIDNC